MIGQILENEERVHISSWEEAQIFFDFYKNVCNASHGTVGLSNWKMYPYFQLAEGLKEYEIVGYMRRASRTYEFREWQALVDIENAETDNEVILENCELI